MATIANKISFKNAEIIVVRDEDDVIEKIEVHEYLKDATLVYDLVAEMEKFAGKDNLKISISEDKEATPVREGM